MVLIYLQFIIDSDGADFIVFLLFSRLSCWTEMLVEFIPRLLAIAWKVTAIAYGCDCAVGIVVDNRMIWIIWKSLSPKLPFDALNVTDYSSELSQRRHCSPIEARSIQAQIHSHYSSPRDNEFDVPSARNWKSWLVICTDQHKTSC